MFRRCFLPDGKIQGITFFGLPVKRARFVQEVFQDPAGKFSVMISPLVILTDVKIDRSV
ncbi:hypothetical protein D9M69_659840 [compost metagenome]